MGGRALLVVVGVLMVLGIPLCPAEKVHDMGLGKVVRAVVQDVEKAGETMGVRHHEELTELLPRTAHTVASELHGVDDFLGSEEEKAEREGQKRGEDDDFFKFLPVFKTAVRPGQSTNWTGSCFGTNVATFQPGGKGGVLEVKTTNPRSLLCKDLYLVATPESLYVASFFFHGTHNVALKEYKSSSEQAFVEKYGLQIFEVQEGIIETLRSVWDTYTLFSEGPHMVERNLQFLKDHAAITFTPRPNAEPILLPEDVWKSGDYLGITRLDGLDPMIMFGTGTHTGHTAVALWIDGALFICEATAADPFAKPYWPPPYGIIRTPYRQWMQQAMDADYLVVRLPLSSKSRAAFNETEAVNWFRKVEGLPYGFHNFIFGWIDTPRGNYPAPLSEELVMTGFVLFDRLAPDTARKMWNEALNMRLKTHDLRTFEIIEEAARRNISFGELMSMPEQDSWVYSDGPSMVCDVFVVAMYKAAGVFGAMGRDIMATEQTPRDSYQMQIFGVDVPEMCRRDGLPYCQLLGRYRLDLPGFNTIPPYSHMNERCAALPPYYAHERMC